MLVVNNYLLPNFTLEDMKDKVKKNSFPNLDKLLQISITISLSSFSIMWWIKKTG
jgi:hypothetical protein